MEIENIDHQIVHDNKVFKKYISHLQIESRLNELSDELNDYYINKSPLIIGILNGCIYFMMDLLKKFNFKYQIDFIKAGSYKGTKRLNLNIESISDKKYYNNDILIIEDIIDSGQTLNKVCSKLANNNPKDIKIITLLNKNTKKRKTTFDIDWVAFNIIDKYVIGYGLDYNNLFRYLKDIYIENEEK